MSKHKRSKTDLDILFHEIERALDDADFILAEDLCDELIDVSNEIYKVDVESQERKPVILQ